MAYPVDDESNIQNAKCTISVGDLVRVGSYDWIARGVGIVTEVRELVHDQSQESYVAVTAKIGGTDYTFSHLDFELVSKVSEE